MKSKNAIRQALQLYGVKFCLIGLMFGIFACGSQNKTESTSDSGIQADSLLLADTTLVDSVQKEPITEPNASINENSKATTPETVVKKTNRKQVAVPANEATSAPAPEANSEPKIIEPAPVLVPPVIKKTEEVKAVVPAPAKKGKVITPTPVEPKQKNKKKTKNDEEVEVDNL